MNNVLDLLENTAQRLPNKIAVSDPSSSLTFDELCHTARAIGTWLIKKGVQPRSAVALYLEKSPLALASMLGAVYAGAFYSVIDVRQPDNRVHHICEALETDIVLTDSANVERTHELFEDSSMDVVQIENLVKEDEDDALLSCVRKSATDCDPLYVNFTSGSTGTPKGVVVCHRSVLDFIGVFTQAFGIEGQDRIANQAPFDFDVSVKDIYSCLLTGATLYLVPRTYFSNPTELMDYLCECKATTLTWAVSALCFVSIMGGFDYRVPADVKRVLFSGEVMPPKQLAVWKKHLPQATFVNLYGPTEITCNCTYFVVDHAYEANKTIPMGKSFFNETVFLLDDKNNLVETTNTDGVGEVCVAGTCLALGYLGDLQRTAESFVQNPLNQRWRQTIYRTGDLARYNEEGDLVFVSRKDNQIKHLGQRIELGDIETAAQGVDDVEQACCLYDSQRKRLVLCYVGAVERKDLKARLRVLLPSYMVPNKTKQLDEMPLTKNGKIDRNVLATLTRIKR